MLHYIWFIIPYYINPAAILELYFNVTHILANEKDV